MHTLDKWTPGTYATAKIVDAANSSFQHTSFQGIEDYRFSEPDVKTIDCNLVYQALEDTGISGDSIEIANSPDATEYAAKYFEYNCFSRIYVCVFENADQSEKIHIKMDMDYITKGGRTFMIDPMEPLQMHFVSTLSMTTDAESTNQLFDLTMKVDVPSDLQDFSALPEWTTYHTANSEGTRSLRDVINGDKPAADRVESEQRFRISTFFEKAEARQKYGLYPVSLFAILRSQGQKDENLLSSKEMTKQESSILEPKTDLCGISADILTNRSSLSEFGKLVPIYKGIFQDEVSAEDGSFYNPTSLDLKQFMHRSVVSPKLMSILSSKNLYISSVLEDELMPQLEKGGIDFDTSSLSWLMTNNIRLDYAPEFYTFDLSFCFIGAVITKEQAVPSNSYSKKLEHLQTYVMYDESECKSLVRDGIDTFTSASNPDQAKGCFVNDVQHEGGGRLKYSFEYNSGDKRIREDSPVTDLIYAKS
ncbi:hypothetical protein CYMTET_34861 [Cymbomonas tetramitiformis]|uniref:Uncharacterized protein n=1 Tax=Cymbomonas tetramitiformis TaxID=36881 RepID=A0AAE0FAT4_9CHLO|nr:hypothetical protein CYMTET_34861 [Cymbomonas tetramitiformis]